MNLFEFFVNRCFVHLVNISLTKAEIPALCNSDTKRNTILTASLKVKTQE